MNKGFAAPLVLIVVGLVIGVIGAVSFSQLRSKPSPTPQLQTPQTSPAPTTASDGTAGWKIYSDGKLEFSIKYPPEIAIRRTLSEGGVEFVSLDDLNKDFRELNMLTVYFRGNAGADPEKVFKDGECPKPCNDSTENVKLNNAVGIRTLGPSYPDEHNYYLTNQDETAPVVRLFIIPNPADPNKDLNQFKKMIPTFKFL